MTKLFKKILIANRGEIAVRIIRACQELGIGTVAVYSDADEFSLHTRLADEARYLGPAPPRESYLHFDRILDAARLAGADAIHPGYGFLAENAAFAGAVQKAGLTFIGPKPKAIHAMGDKAAARTQMQGAGVPVIPGYQGADDTLSMDAEAQKVGYPVLVKAAAGGGGKGMRVVWEPDDLPEELSAARREAQHAFGDERLILEKFIHRACHIEFQIFADHHGNMVHMFERECSIQRRHQKIIEESPSPLVDAELRARMGGAAIAAAKAVNYENAGTVEFIVDPRTQDFYFLEMNTRLQVEHPVTELITGLDLVEWQIRVAAGEALPFSQDTLTLRGHALECRLYAEDPANNFLPASGPLLKFVAPQGPGVRIDSGVASGDRITTHYDPLLAKLIVHAEGRAAAIRRMLTALDQTVVLGLTSNLAFLKAVLKHPDFRSGVATTHFIERNFSHWKADEVEISPEALIAAALIDFHSQETRPSETTENDPFSPWNQRDGFRLGGNTT
jgi:acetyl-CoA carboxylase biotin carboxylase subunit